MKEILHKDFGFKNDNIVCTIALFEMSQNEKTRLIIIPDADVCPYPTIAEKVSIINHSNKIQKLLY